jgi:hypothetical protein
MAMKSRLCWLNPNTQGSRFDLDYNVKSHRALVEESWGGKGMTSFKAVKGTGTPNPTTPAPIR